DRPADATSDGHAATAPPVPADATRTRNTAAHTVAAGPADPSAARSIGHDRAVGHRQHAARAHNHAAGTTRATGAPGAAQAAGAGAALGPGAARSGRVAADRAPGDVHGSALTGDRATDASAAARAADAAGAAGGSAVATAAGLVARDRHPGEGQRADVEDSS